jgi:CO/xanthine dehydrogenase FAD-binding subunit
VPPLAGRAGCFAKIGGWSGDFAMVSAALVARPEGGTLSHPTVVLGAIAPVPWVAPSTRRLTRIAGDALADVVGADLVRAAHPLPGNGWKLDAAVGLVSRLSTRLSRDE